MSVSPKCNTNTCRDTGTGVWLVFLLMGFTLVTGVLGCRALTIASLSNINSKGRAFQLAANILNSNDSYTFTNMCE